MSKKGLIFHDYFSQYEGGGRVSLLMARHLNWPVVCGYISPELELPLSIPIHPLTSFRLRPQPLFILYLIWLFRHKIISLKISTSQTAIFSGFYSINAARHIIGPKILYCHTPPRYAYDQFSFYYTKLSPVQRPFFRLLVRIVRYFYEDAIRRMNIVLSNSQNVQKRLKTFLGLDSQVLYPPVETRQFQYLGQKDYYLSVARLDPLKRVDLIVKAFKQIPEKKLIVASGGPELLRIKRLAQGSPNIKVLGWVSEETLRKLIGYCIAGIYLPRDEDFGLFPVELMAAGKPVIGVNEGGLKETIVHGKTGILLPPEPSEEDIIQAIKKLSPETAQTMKGDCINQARHFDTEIFFKKLNKYLEDLSYY